MSDVKLSLEGSMVDTPESVVTTNTDTKATNKEQKLSERDFQIAVRKAYKERSEKVKQNKAMIEEMNLEVAYWKAQSDLLKYRFEKMDYYLKNLDLEPLYLAKVEEQRQKDEASNSLQQDLSKPKIETLS